MSSQYRIFNAQFTNQVTDLLFGQPTPAIRVVGNNSGLLNMVWNFNTAGQWNECMISSAALSANGATASVSQVTANPGSLVSNPCNPVQLVWSLATGNDGVPNESTQIWTVVSKPHAGGNVARGINELN
ncbi:hypothetical protein OG21DRAFT_1520999 [Imleria badia]|nr:hypothetical protein OG21DRAFT_1520999 [Imleria badia]